MKLTTECPECLSTEIYYRESRLTGPAATILPNAGGLLSGVRIVVYVCGNCGCYRSFIGEEHLEKVKRKWNRVG